MMSVAKPKLKAKTMEQALSAAEADLAEKALELVGLRAALHTEEISKVSELDKLQATLRVERGKRAVQAVELYAEIHKKELRIDALLWVLVGAQEECRQQALELRQKDGDKLALAG